MPYLPTPTPIATRTQHGNTAWSLQTDQVKFSQSRLPIRPTPLHTTYPYTTVQTHLRTHAHRWFKESIVIMPYSLCSCLTKCGAGKVLEIARAVVLLPCNPDTIATIFHHAEHSRLPIILEITSSVYIRSGGGGSNIFGQTLMKMQNSAFDKLGRFKWRNPLSMTYGVGME